MQEIRNHQRRKAAAALGALLVSVGLTSTPASAGHLTCGAVVTASTTLDADIGPCPGNGLVINGSNLTLDLNGHRIFGTSGPTAVLDTGVGVVINGASSVVVKNGTISDFDAGVLILSAAGNEVSGLTIRDNIPSDVAAGDYGDGITIRGKDSDNNHLLNNTVVNNGPFSGISAFEGVVADKITGTVISGNTVKDNNVSSQTGGIRLENWTWNTTVSNNTVKGNALEGIALFADTQFTTVSGNVVRDNGFTSTTATHRKGDGIRAFPRTASNVVENNDVFGNAGNGIFIEGPIVNSSGVTTVVGSTSNQILTNDTGDNSAAPTVDINGGGASVTIRLHQQVTINDQTLVLPPPAATSDLRDGNPNCADNVWSGNTYDTATPACTTA